MALECTIDCFTGCAHHGISPLKIRYFQHSSNFLLAFFFLYVYVCAVCMQVCAPVSCSAAKFRRGCQIPLELEFSWNWLRQFSAAMWVLGIEPGSSARAVGTLNR